MFYLFKQLAPYLNIYSIDSFFFLAHHNFSFLSVYNQIYISNIYKQTERNLRTFEHRVYRKICGPVIDDTTRNWWRRYNRELYEMLELEPVTSYINGQRIQWLLHLARSVLGQNKMCYA
jgi:hypothetical protein